MKKLTPVIITALLLLCVCFAFFIQTQRKGETVLSIKDSETRYTFKASFYAGITPKVTGYMDSCANYSGQKMPISGLKLRRVIY